MSGPGTIDEQRARRDLARICARLYDRFYLVATDGNVSVRLGDSWIVATPAGVNKGFIGPEDMVVTDMAGKKVSGPGRPSSELAMHVRTYEERRDLRAVVHAHPATATAFACSGLPLDDCLMTEAVVGLGAVPLAPFALPSTAAIPESIAPLIRETDVLMLANHGVLAAGTNLMEAYNKMEGIEQFARVALMTRLLGGPKLLDKEQVGQLEALRERYGLPGKQMSCTPPAARATDPQDDLIETIAAQVLKSMGRL